MFSGVKGVIEGHKRGYINGLVCNKVVLWFTDLYLCVS